MRVMLPILSSLLLVMAVGGGLHTYSVIAEETVISNTARITAYWQTMLPNTPMPSAILDLLTTTDGNNDRITKQDTDNILAAEKETSEKNSAAPFLKPRKLRPHAEKSQILGEDQKIDDQNLLLYGQAVKNENQKVRHWYGPTARNDDQNLLLYGQAEKNEDQKVRHWYGPTAKNDDQNLLLYGQAEKNDDKTTKSNVQDDGHEREGGHFHGGITTAQNDQNLLLYGQAEKNEDQKVRHWYGPTAKNDDQNLLLYGKAEKNDGETTKSNVQDDGHEREGGHIHGGITTAKNDQNLLLYGQAEKNEDQKVRHWYGPTAKNDDQNLLLYGKVEKNDDETAKSNVQDDGHEREGGHIHGGITTVKNNDQNLLLYGQAEKNEDQKVQYWYGPITKNDDQNLLLYGKVEKNDSETTKSNVQDDGHEREGGHIHGGITTAKNDDQNLLLYGQAEKNEDQKVRHWYGPTAKNDDQNLLLYGQAEKNDSEITKSNVQDEGESGHIHGGVTFSEDSVIPGSTIEPHILPSFTLGASLLPRHVADSVPMSTRNFTYIMTMFAPVSYAMADDIWSTLYLCDHPPLVKGETNVCIVSIESMVEFVSSVLGTTHDLRALSSPDVPADGVKSGKRYKVTELRRVTEAGDTVTCHGLRFPSAMFMCHAVNPTRVYSVTLERDCDDADVGGPERMEALAVCHLDTSDFDPTKMPEHVKPGDAPLCHFLARDNVLWAPPAAVAA